jgi:hypothetical protein
LGLGVRIGRDIRTGGRMLDWKGDADGRMIGREIQE